MADLEEKLNAILGNPEAMGQIMSIARSLSDGGDSSGQPSDKADQSEHSDGHSETDEASTAQAPSEAGVAALLAGLSRTGEQDGEALPLSSLSSLDPKLIQIAIQLFTAYSAEDDRRTALLSALKPFLKEERQAKMEKAIQIAKISRVIRVALQLFRKEGDDV